MQDIIDSFDVIPLRGAAPIELGMTRQESRAAMGIPAGPYWKKAADESLAGMYLYGCYQVFFGADDWVNCIAPARSF